MPEEEQVKTENESNVDIAAQTIVEEDAPLSNNESDDMISLSDFEIEDPADKKEETTVEETPVEDKKEEEVPSVEDTVEKLFETITPDNTQTQAEGQNQNQNEVAARVLDGLPEEEQALFKQMSNEAYNKYYPEILELRKQANNASVYNNPEGYKLTPEYDSAVTNYSSLQTYIDHLEGQLQRPDNLLVPLQANENGEVVTGAEIQVTDAEKLQVQQGIYNLKQQQNAQLQTVQNLEQNFQQQHGQRKDKLVSFLSKFGQFATQTDSVESKQMQTTLQDMGLHNDLLSPVVTTLYNALIPDS